MGNLQVLELIAGFVPQQPVVVICTLLFIHGGSFHGFSSVEFSGNNTMVAVAHKASLSQNGHTLTCFGWSRALKE